MRPLVASTVLVVMVLVVPVLSTGCGDGGGSTPPDANGDVPDAGCVPGPDAAPSSHALGDVNGSWAVVEHSYAVVSALNATQISREVYTFTITQTGTDLAIVEQMCNIQVDDENHLESTRMLPALFPLPPVNRVGTLTGDATAGFTLATVKAYRTRGVNLTDIETEALPTAADDPRLLDQDSDNHPGITLLLDGILRGQAYVVQRDWNQYDAKQVAPDLIEGHTVWGSEQVYLGADPMSIYDLLKNSPPQPHPDASKHVVRLVRIPDGSDCAYVMANQCTLFAGQ